jgi:hypothetical protein
MLMKNLGKQCRDVACYVWERGEMRKMRKMGEQGKMRKMGKLTQNSTYLFPVNC